MTDHERLCELLEGAEIAAKAVGDNLRASSYETFRARLRSNGPDGLRVVPVEPTPKMVLAGSASPGKKWATITGESVILRYKAMLRAGGERADG